MFCFILTVRMYIYRWAAKYPIKLFYYAIQIWNDITIIISLDSFSHYVLYMRDANGRCKYYHKCLETHFYKCSSRRAAAFYWLIHGRGSVEVAAATLTHTLNTHTHCTTGTRGTIHPLAWVQLSVTMLHLMPSNNQFNLCWPKNAGRVSGRKDVCYIFVLGPFPSCLHVPSLWTCRRCRDGMGCTERRPPSTSTDRHLGSTF